MPAPFDDENREHVIRLAQALGGTLEFRDEPTSRAEFEQLLADDPYGKSIPRRGWRFRSRTGVELGIDMPGRSERDCTAFACDAILRYVAAGIVT